MSRAQLQGSNLTACQTSAGRKWGYKTASSSALANESGNGPRPQKGGNKNQQETFFCSTYQRDQCWYEGAHQGKYNGRMVTRQHICAACWLKDKVQANHPESSKECPHNKWLGEQKGQHPRVGLLKANQIINQSQKPNYLGARIRTHSKININFLESVIHREDDQLTLEFLKYGCPIGLDKGASLDNRPFPNHRGAREFPSEIDNYIQREIEKGACIGPFQKNPFDRACHVSPLNSVEKKDSAEPSAILDLSFPPGGASVNAAIDMSLVADRDLSLRYPLIDSLVDLVVECGRGSAMFKRDLKRTYRQIPVDPGDIHVLGYRWDNEMYFDTSLPMGLKSAALFCQRLTNLIRHILEDRGVKTVNYLDDFGGAATWEQADRNYSVLGEVLNQAGLGDAVEKRCSPANQMLFLGILFDSSNLTVSIDSNRLQELRDLLDSWLTAEQCTRKQLESLLGKLKFAAACVRPGRISTMRLLSELRNAPKSGSFPISSEAKADLTWWRRFLVSYNGVSMMPEEEWSAPGAVFTTDACLEGCGGWFQGRIFHSEFPRSVLQQALHINALELLTILVALRLWAH